VNANLSGVDPSPSPSPSPSHGITAVAVAVAVGYSRQQASLLLQIASRRRILALFFLKPISNYVIRLLDPPVKNEILAFET
jgi:hypothetical protein